MSIEGSGDKLARGAKAANFTMGGGKKDDPIELKNVAAPDACGEDVLHSRVDNSALFAKKKPVVYYKGTPLADMVLVRRVQKQSNSMIVLPDSAQAKSDMGIVAGVGVGAVDITTGQRTPLSVQEGDLILFDKFASVGMEVSLLDANGDEQEHLILREHDILLKLTEVREAAPLTQ